MTRPTGARGLQVGKRKGADLFCPQRREGMGEAGVVLLFRELKDKADVDPLGAHGGFKKAM